MALAVQQFGSPLLGITAAQTQEVLDAAIASWHGVDCGGAAPVFQFVQVEAVSCAEVEYNPGGPNVNVIMYRDDRWKHSISATALTTLTFGTETGQIFAADVELNSSWYQFTLGDELVSTDLQATLTHELGHALGLSHSNDPQATMYAFQASGETQLRTLELDDQQGLCHAYPPGVSPVCEPYRDFSDRCGGNLIGEGCHLTRARGNRSLGPWHPATFWGALGLLALLRRRRSCPEPIS